MTNDPVKLHCEAAGCVDLIGMNVIRYSCIVCGKKKNEPYYVVDGVPCVCQECGKKALELKPKVWQI